MITKVQKWGNSQGLRLSKELLSNVEVGVGDAVDVAARDGVLGRSTSRARGTSSPSASILDLDTGKRGVGLRS
jgi:antitoxin component of MazEF toxin-antitoxin module